MKIFGDVQTNKNAKLKTKTSNQIGSVSWLFVYTDPLYSRRAPYYILYSTQRLHFVMHDVLVVYPYDSILLILMITLYWTVQQICLSLSFPRVWPFASHRVHPNSK